MIQIFSNQTAVFNNPADYDDKQTAQAYEFATVKDWVPESAMFKLLKSQGKIKLIGSAADISALEQTGKVTMGDLDKVDGLGDPDDPDDNEEATDYSEMSSKKLYKICKERGLEVEEKQPKEYYIETLSKSEA